MVLVDGEVSAAGCGLINGSVSAPLGGVVAVVFVCEKAVIA